MHSKTTIPISDLRKNLFEITEDITRTGRNYTLTQRGIPTVVLMPVEKYESWKETLEVIKEMPNLAKEIMEGRKEFKKGKTIGLEQILRERGFHALAEQYEKNLSTRSKASGSQRVAKNTK